MQDVQVRDAVYFSSRWRAVVASMRPRQFTKNLVVFAALGFSGDLLDAQRIVAATVAFVLFCLLTGAVYILNDVVDAESDRLHPTKRTRPIASGALPVSIAVGAGATFGAVALLGAFALGWQFGLVALGYALLQIAYSGWLKKVVIVDAMAIAVGFVLRAVAGAAVVGVLPSSWLLLCTFLLALFLALAKRRHELLLLEDDAGEHRTSLSEYTPEMIDSLLSATTSATILAYALYTFLPVSGERYPYLMLTVPFVAYGLFRYLYLVHRHDLGGRPEEILLTDRPLIIGIVGWLVTTAFIIYVLPS